MNFLTSLSTIGFVIAMAIPGFVIKKLKLIPNGSIGVLIIVLMYVCQSFLTISSFSKKAFEVRLLINIGWTFLFAIIVQMIVYFLAKLCFCKVKDEGNKRACVVTSFMSNCGFMGIPLMQALFPDKPELIIYSAVFLIVFNILSWTLVVYSYTGEKKFISFRKAFLNPPTLSLVVALPLFFFSVKLPFALQNSIDLLGNMTLPLSMIIIGIRLADIKLSSLFTSFKVYIAIFIRLIISPLLTLGILLLVKLFLPLDDLVVMALYLIMAMPTATASVMFAEIYRGDTVTSLKVVLLSSIVCILTIPLLMLLLPII